ncbi:leucine-rich repeat domain-containing protein [Paraliomyxa miuraensis]|uniref:hypothetical protein n=1 Tax=Paraliomyxa miuraensis TaxID=376150 RepID=UPI00225A8D4E|nr:hypothetical protein [Paraliomyxa miuraensis]MCX4245450.1 hypothetical protein [Paraliomyxa miuraensis]
MSAGWIETLRLLDERSVEFATIVARFLAPTDVFFDGFGQEVLYFVHDGDLELEEGREVWTTLVARCHGIDPSRVPALIVLGSLRTTRSLDFGDHILGIATTGDLECRDFVSDFVALAVAGDLLVERYFCSREGHAIVNVAGATKAQYIFEPAHGAYVLNADPSAILLDSDRIDPACLDAGMLPGQRFFEALEAGRDPFLIAPPAPPHDVERAAALLKAARFRSYRCLGSAEEAPDELWSMPLVELEFPEGGAPSPEIGGLSSLRVLRGGPGFVVPEAIGSLTALETLLVPRSTVPRSIGALPSLQVLHCVLDDAGADAVSELVSLRELVVACASDLQRLPLLTPLEHLQRLTIRGAPGQAHVLSGMGRTSAQEVALHGFEFAHGAELEGLFAGLAEAEQLLVDVRVRDGTLPRSLFALGDSIRTLTIEVEAFAPPTIRRLKSTFGRSLRG